jgi:hypothetical protein
MCKVEEYDKDLTIPSCHLSQILHRMQWPFDGQDLPSAFFGKELEFR